MVWMDLKIRSRTERMHQIKGLTNKSPRKGAHMSCGKRKVATKMIPQLREKRKKIEPKNPVELRSSHY